MNTGNVSLAARVRPPARRSLTHASRAERGGVQRDALARYVPLRPGASSHASRARSHLAEWAHTPEEFYKLQASQPLAVRMRARARARVRLRAI